MQLGLSQLGAFVWLKWRLFRNALRTKRGAGNRAASLVVFVLLLLFALSGAVKLGFVTYALTMGGRTAQPLKAQAAAAGVDLTLSFVLFATLSFIYLLWATLPLSLGGGGQFTPGRLLMYPVSLRQLFALDLLSELTSTASVFAVPALFAMALGAGLATGRTGAALLIAVCACVFGVALAKLLATSIGTLMERKRSRGESLLALVGLVAALSGVLLGQGARHFEHAQSFPRALEWTPPGAVVSALTEGLRADGAHAYWRAFGTLLGWAMCAVVVTYLMARRSALGTGGGGGSGRRTTQRQAGAQLIGELPGWQVPFASPQLATVLAKELRYAARNAPLRVMAFMPVIMTLSFKLAQTNEGQADAVLSRWTTSQYFDGARAATSVLYVFLITSALNFNLFGYEGAGLRAFILAPVTRRTILVGKNLAMLVVALLFALIVTGFNQLVFRDLTGHALLFVALAFVWFAGLFATVGNWLSVRFPKRLEFGKRMNASGVAALIILPLFVAAATPLAVAVFAGYRARSLAVEYVILALFACAGIGLYLTRINAQGRMLARRELDILDTVTTRDE